MSLTLVTAPIEDFVSLDEAKLHLKVEHDVDDALIQDVIDAAQEQLQALTTQQFNTVTYDYGPVTIPVGSDFLELPRTPVVSVTSVTSYDDDDVATVLSTADYYVDSVNHPGRITLRTTGTWPTDLRARNALIVRFVAGYTAVTVPKRAKVATKMLAAHLYARRESSIVEVLQRDPVFADLVESLNVGALC